MSLLTFPAFNPPQWSFKWPIKQTPFGNTITQTPASGRGEVRIPTMLFPRWDFVLDISYLKGDNQLASVNTAYQELVNFFLGTQYGAADWLFLHPYDNLVGVYSVNGAVTGATGFTAYNRFGLTETVVQTTSGASAKLVGAVPGAGPMLIGPITGTPDGSHTWVGQVSGAVFTPSAAPALSTSQAIGTGDGTTVAWSMVRSLIVAGAYDLIQNFVSAPSIYLNGVIDSPSNYAIDEYGTITFTSAPGAGVIVSWTGQFYYRCHFLQDRWDDLEEFIYKIWRMNTLSFRSVLL
jgi:hypothetical protein